jgi:hypothetical protein
MGLRLVRNDVGESVGITVRDVEAEARRRISDLGYEGHRARERATGIPMPTSVKVRQLQIAAIAMAIAALDDIPGDFRADIYWG